ncbi:hypothetical protein GC176_15815 [bacterium]|nr:hypothetical protein [bacterium]
MSDDVDPEREAALARRRRWQTVGVYAANFALHGLLLLVLALIVLPVESLPASFRIFSSMEPSEIEPEDLETLDLKLPEKIEHSLPTEVLPEIVRQKPEPFSVDVNDLTPRMPRIPEPGPGDSPIVPVTGDLGGRSQAAKEALLSRYGGTPESEAAVARALKWLAHHQRDDGSWSFDHRTPQCDGSCSMSGSFGNSNMGATALALLTYMGSGSSYTDGKYQKTIENGIVYLLKNARPVRNGQSLDLRGDFQGNSGMYIQGLATLCLTEAIAMNELAIDEAGRNAATIGVKEASTVHEETQVLRIAAQKAVNFIANAQHSRGGWRYTPGEAGDTSVVGWQIMALTSGRSAGLQVSRTVFTRASRFLDRVSRDDGAFYGYMGPAKKESTTAIGLLCRMYLGWDRLRPGLRNGVAFLDETGPAKGDIYYNYYATQVLHHWGGDEWKAWNGKMREQLVTTQKKDGHAAGSWDLADVHGAPGGRLYMTCLAAMTLEVYYRHLPLYEQFDKRRVADR